MEKKITITMASGGNLLKIDYHDGTKKETDALIMLVDHAPHMSFITHGNSEKIARLIFGAYKIALARASEGSLQDAWFVEMFEKVCRDITAFAGYRERKVDPDKFLDEIERGEGGKFQ